MAPRKPTPDTDELDGMPPRQVLLQLRYKLAPIAVLIDPSDVLKVGEAQHLTLDIHGEVTQVTETLRDGVTVFTVTVTEVDA